MNGTSDLSQTVQKFLLSLSFIPITSDLFINIKESNSKDLSNEIVGIVWDLENNKGTSKHNQIDKFLSVNEKNYLKYQFIYFKFTNIIEISFIKETESLTIFHGDISSESSENPNKLKKIPKNFIYLCEIFKDLNLIFVKLEKRNNICNILASMFYLSYNFSKRGNCLGPNEISLLFGDYSVIKRILLHHLTNLLKENHNYINNWKQKYELLYDHRGLTNEFFLNISYFLFILDFLCLKSETLISKLDFQYNFQDICQLLGNKNYEPEYNFFLKKSNEFYFFIKFLHNLLGNITFKTQDLFSVIYQELVYSPIRHSLGEVYTPSYLIEAMIKSKIKSHRSFMDPSCGCGSFLIEILNYYMNIDYNAINNVKIYGIDINPIAIHCCKINLLILMNSYRLKYQINDLFNNLDIKIILDDALSPKNEETLKISQNKVDFIIGNPPWLNISSIFLQDVKEKIKNIGKDLKILYGPEAKNTEICTIFFFKCRELYLKHGGSIFFVLPASVLNGHQHVYFRYLDKFKNIEVWRFKQDIFLIHNICLYAEYDENISKENIDSIQNRLSLRDLFFELKPSDKYFQQVQLILKENKISQPLYIKMDNKKKNYPMIGRYNPINPISFDSNYSYIDVKPCISYYYPFVKGNIRIVPRRWLIIKERPPFDECVVIHPDIDQQAKDMWSNPPYSEYEIESDSIKPIYKSEQLIPFAFVFKNYAFLPITSQNKSGSYFILEKMGPKAAQLYNLLDESFRKKIKPSASMKTLEDNLTFNGRLIPSNLINNGNQKFMVVHNSIGSIVKSVVLTESIILDNSLYCFITDNEDEAFYLSGVLNSPEITFLVKKIGSSGSRGSLRNIHKNPYNFPIPKYDGSTLHVEISHISQNLHRFVQTFLLKNSSNFETKSVRALQKQLFLTEDYIKLLKKLNEYVIKLFSI